MKKRFGAVTLACFLAACPAAAGEKLSLSGYAKNFSMVFSMPGPENGAGGFPKRLMGVSSFRTRLKMSVAPTDRISFQIADEISPRFQDQFFARSSAFVFSLDPSGYRVADFRDPLIPGPNDPAGNFGLYHNLDRLSVTIKTGIGDWTVGRQPIAWGSARAVNPTDIIAPFSFNDLDKEERYGVDAIRLRVPLGTLSELDMGYVPGKKFNFEQSAFFARSRFDIAKTDLTLILLGFRRDLLMGIDVARSLGGAGFWLEGAYIVPDAFDKNSAPRGRDYLRLSAGLDGSLNGKTYAFLEYHFNSAGLSRPESYPDLLSEPAYARGSTYLLGRHYLFASLNYQLSPLIPVTGMVVYNASDQSLSLSPQVEYNISKNTYVAAGAYLGIGRRPGSTLFTDPPGRPDLRSEFGSYPDFAYVSFRLYF